MTTEPPRKPQNTNDTPSTVVADSWEQRTISRAGCDAAGAVDGPLPGAVAALVPGRRVIAVAVGKLHPTPTRARTLAPGPPGPPVAVA